MTDQTTATTSETYRDRLRLRILHAAKRIIRAEGLQAVQARRVAKDAECSVGTLYNIFGEIDDLLMAVNSDTLGDLGRHLTATLEQVAGEPLIDRLMALANTYLEFAVAHRRRWRAIFEHVLPEKKQRPPSFLTDRTRLLALIEDQLAELVPEPGPRADAARALFASVHGIVQLSLDGRLGAVSTNDCERHIRFVVELVIGGLRTRADTQPTP